MSSKNIAKGSFDEIAIEEGFLVLTYQNQSDGIQTLERHIDSHFIQFHFCLRGSVDFQFNNGNYTFGITEEQSLLLYNPQRELPIHLNAKPKTWLISALISIEKFHGLFSQEANYVTFLSEDNKDKKILF